MGKILVTGADGFIGSHLTERLVADGHDVRALCMYNSFGSWGWLDESPIRNKVEVVLGDIRDQHFCRGLTKEVDTVFHLAALIAIPFSYHAPDLYIQTNVIGTSNMGLAALEAGVQRFVHTSTSEVYGTAKYVPINEEHPLQPQSPYSASKIGADSMIMSYFNAFQLPVTIARPFNTYGPRQSARAIIPTLISQMASGKKEIQVGDLRPTRDLNYVSDTCEGLIRIGTTSHLLGKTINIGSNFEVSMEVVFETIREILKVDARAVVDQHRLRPENSEVFRLWADNAKIKDLTGFVPSVSLREGLEKTAAWFLDERNLAKYKADRYNI